MSDNPNKKTGQFVADLATAVVKDQTDRQPHLVNPTGVKEHLDVTMTPPLERSKSVGSPQAPSYWAERVYQACVSGLYGNSPADAYKGVLRQAERQGISDGQRKELERYLSAAGIDVGTAEQDNLNDPYKFAKGDKRAAQHQTPESDVTGSIVAAVSQQINQRHAVEKLGRIIAAAKQRQAQSKRTASVNRGQRIETDLREFAKAVAQPVDAETVFRMAKAHLLGQRNASMSPQKLRGHVTLVVACTGEEGRSLLKEGFSHAEVAKHIARKQRAQMSPTVEVKPGGTPSTAPLPPGVAVTKKKTTDGKDATVVTQDSKPLITAQLDQGAAQFPSKEEVAAWMEQQGGIEQFKSQEDDPNNNAFDVVERVLDAYFAAHPEILVDDGNYANLLEEIATWDSYEVPSREAQYTSACAQCGRHVRPAGAKHIDGKWYCNTCTPGDRTPQRTSSLDEQRLAAAVRSLTAGAQPSTLDSQPSTDAPMSRAALLDELTATHEQGGCTLPARDIVAALVDSGQIQNKESLRVELARAMS